MIIEKDANAAKQRAANRKSHKKNGRPGRIYPVRLRDQKVRARECIRRLISGGITNVHRAKGAVQKPDLASTHITMTTPNPMMWNGFVVGVMPLKTEGSWSRLDPKHHLSSGRFKLVYVVAMTACYSVGDAKYFCVQIVELTSLDVQDVWK